jgi:hypothetical protein
LKAEAAANAEAESCGGNIKRATGGEEAATSLNEQGKKRAIGVVVGEEAPTVGYVAAGSLNKLEAQTAPLVDAGAATQEKKEANKSKTPADTPAESEVEAQTTPEANAAAEKQTIPEAEAQAAPVAVAAASTQQEKEATESTTPEDAKAEAEAEAQKTPVANAAAEQKNVRDAEGQKASVPRAGETAGGNDDLKASEAAGGNDDLSDIDFSVLNGSFDTAAEQAIGIQSAAGEQKVEGDEEGGQKPNQAGEQKASLSRPPLPCATCERSFTEPSDLIRYVGPFSVRDSRREAIDVQIAVCHFCLLEKEADDVYIQYYKSLDTMAWLLAQMHLRKPFQL